MEWVMMYSGRPSSSEERRVAESPTTVAERESKQAEDYVNENAHVPLEELLASNKQNQKLKIIEYHQLKARKCPTLEEQKRGPNGRIIFSQEYIDHMFYRDLQPLIDLRILGYIEEIIMNRISKRDSETKGAKENEAGAEIRFPWKVSLQNKAQAEFQVVPFSPMMFLSLRLLHKTLFLPLMTALNLMKFQVSKLNSVVLFFYGLGSIKSVARTIRKTDDELKIFQCSGYILCF
uniref:PAZ domain-containing protein n=1 Tax=Caenorhabditis tropicalis TaxID=1561998 RepID=A0A1I7V3J3_9PELO